MANWKLRELRGERRRTFLKMCGVVSAAVGIERTRMLDFLAGEGGYGLAEAQGTTYGRALIVPCPSGSFAWMQELWPMPDLAVQSVVGNLGNVTSYLYCSAYNYGGLGSLAAAQGAPATYRGTYAGPYGKAKNAAAADIKYTQIDPTGVNPLQYTSGDRPMFYSPDAPWFNHVTGKPVYPVSCFMSGRDETHTPFPVSATQLSNAAVLQGALSALGASGSNAIVPVLGLDPVRYGRAPGAPEVATVPSAQGMIDLFNSAASQFALKKQGDQQLFETYFKAVIGLRKSAARSSWAPQLQLNKNAARIIGLNFATQLTPAQKDLDAFGITELANNYGPNMSGLAFLSQDQKTSLDSFLRSLVVVSKAFALGLSKTAIISLSSNGGNTFTDPHETFNSPAKMNAARNTTRFIGKALDVFYKTLAQYPDPESPGEMLDKNTVFVSYGDTPHDPLTGFTSQWQDQTPDTCNFLYVMDPKGNIKNGWFGQCYPDNNKQIGPKKAMNAVGFDPVTGLDDPGKTSAACASFASTAAVFACAHGDKNKTAEFGSSPNTIPALVKAV
jgi:hypothetical protein